MRNLRKINENNKVKDYFASKKLLLVVWASENDYYAPMQAWHEPFSKYFSNIIKFDTQKSLIQNGQKETNRLFIELLKKEQPDYLFIYLVSDPFYMDTLINIKKICPKIKIISLFGDDDHHFEKYSIFCSSFIDYILGVQTSAFPRYKKYGINNVFFTSIIDPEINKPMEIEKKYDVVFIGTPRKKGGRYEYIKYLKDKGVKIKLFGYGWGDYPEFKDIYLGPLHNKDIIRVINESKINLCFSKNIFGTPHIKGRVFEVAACNSFQLVENSPPLKELFKEGKEMVFFNDGEDLLRKINHYLGNEGEMKKIAKAAYEKIITKYNLNSELGLLMAKIRKDEINNHKPKYLPELNIKIIEISKEDFNNPIDMLNNKIKDADYISFKHRNCLRSRYKNYIQAYFLVKLGKPICCCGYYAYSRGVGNYLLFYPDIAYDSLGKEKFTNFVSLNQLMVTREYFLENIECFENFFEGEKVDIVTKENTAFASIPLLRIFDVKISSYEDMLRAFKIIFIRDIRQRVYSRRLLSSQYVYKFFIEALLLGKFYLLRYLLNESLSKDKIYALKRTLAKR